MLFKIHFLADKRKKRAHDRLIHQEINQNEQEIIDNEFINVDGEQGKFFDAFDED